MVTMTLKVDGMMCGMCEAHVSDAIRNHCPVKKVKASHSKGTVEVTAEREISLAEFHQALDPTGYEIISLEAGPAKKGFFGFGK